MLVPQIILTAYIFPYLLLLPFGLGKLGAKNVFQQKQTVPYDNVYLFLMSLPQPDL
jgi:hypothetical protein